MAAAAAGVAFGKACAVPVCAMLSRAVPAVLCYLQADHLLSLYHGEWKQSVDPIYSPDFTY